MFPHFFIDHHRARFAIDRWTVSICQLYPGRFIFYIWDTTSSCAWTFLLAPVPFPCAFYIIRFLQCRFYRFPHDWMRDRCFFIQIAQLYRSCLFYLPDRDLFAYDTAYLCFAGFRFHHIQDIIRVRFQFLAFMILRDIRHCRCPARCPACLYQFCTACLCRYCRGIGSNSWLYAIPDIRCVLKSEVERWFTIRCIVPLFEF